MSQTRESLLHIGRRGLVAGALTAAFARADAARGAGDPHVSPEQLKAIGDWIGALAIQAATYAAPIVAMYLLRSTTATGPNAKVPANEIWRISNITTPEIAEQAGYVTPNVNVLYGFGFFDLGREPIILTTPDSDGRYYMVQAVDMWTNAFSYPAGAAAGYRGGRFALVGPGWSGELPSGLQRINCPTRWVELQPRVHVKNQADLAGAQAVLAAIKTQGLAEYTGHQAPAAVAYDYAVPRIDPKVASSQMLFEDPLQFWTIFSAAMNENPPPRSEITSVLPVFTYLGIELGKQWKRESANPLVLEQMKAAAGGIGKMMNDSLAVGGRIANGWIIPPPNVGMAGADYLARAIVAVFGLTANTPTEAIYYSAQLDGNGQPLTGTKRYSITFTEPMDYLRPIPPGFWSMTMYDGVTRLTVPNPIGRYALGSDDRLKRNPDGSFTIYIQHDSPDADKEPNWLPAPAGPFYIVLRNYAPVSEVARSLNDVASFQGPPAVVQLNS
jgi:hypothetical protein